MKRTTTRFLLAGVLAILAVSPLAAFGAEAGKVPPEKTYSNAPFLHRIFLRDETDASITAPKPADPKASSGDTERPRLMTTAQTCGKCHAYETMSHGWHFNAWDKSVPAGRAGEPWILTDTLTRTQLPLSYRGWTGTYHPHTIGINDYKFVKLFGRNLPGGGAATHSNDLRFKMSGKLEIDCLICHSLQPYDHVERAKQIMEFENFKWAPIVGSLLGEIRGKAKDLKDTWNPAEPEARQPPKPEYERDRFDSASNVTFQVSRRVANERCFFCHTSIDVGAAKPEQKSLESRWVHDRDVHLAKGMLCVDCHRNGVDHMITRGYEGEYNDRDAAHKDPTVTTLTCRGCHYAAKHEGGRLAAPLPTHKGLPTLHFDKLACTACHSGSVPGDTTTNVQTSLAHRLGFPRNYRIDDMAPKIQETVFLKDRNDPMSRIAPHKLVYPAYWARLQGNAVVPIPPDDVALAGTTSILLPPKEWLTAEGRQIDARKDLPLLELSKEQVLKVLEKLAAAKPPKAKLADAVMGFVSTAPATAPTTNPTTAPSTTQPAAAEPAQPANPAWYTGEPVYITGGKLYKRTADGKDLQAIDHEAAKPYAWALAHNVRSAQQALGARGCTDCHASGAPLFDGKVPSDSVLANATTVSPMHEVRGESLGALAMFAATYPMRPILIATGYICASLLGLLLLTYAGRAISTISRRGR